jgi:hypothetical protein
MTATSRRFDPARCVDPTSTTGPAGATGQTEAPSTPPPPWIALPTPPPPLLADPRKPFARRLVLRWSGSGGAPSR